MKAEGEKLAVPSFYLGLSLLLLAVALWIMTRGWDASLLDRYQFRQTQTALNAYGIQHEGFSLAYPAPIFGPPWSVPFEFPLYQWLVALLANTTGLALVPAARLIGILFFLSSLPAVYGLAARVEPHAGRRLLVPAALLMTPVCLFYARSFMIESCAAAFAVWFLYAYLRSLQLADWRWTIAATLLGVIAALVKITTFALFAVPAGLFAIVLFWQKRPPQGASFFVNLWRSLPAVLLPVGLALAVALRWIAFTDTVKRANPYANQFTSENLRTWNYGTLAQRLDPVFWQTIHRHFSLGVLSDPLFLLLGLGLIPIAQRYRLMALLCAAGYLLGPLLFANLYAIHNYYHFPAAFFAAAAAGLILAGVVASERLDARLKAVYVVIFVSLQGINFYQGFAETLKNLPAPPPSLVEVVHEAVPAHGVVLVYGWDWNTLIPYYAECRAILVPNGAENDADKLQTVLKNLGADQVTALVMQGPHKQDRGFIRWRTEKLGLAAHPVATSADGDLYVRSTELIALKQKLAGRSLPGVTLNFSDSAEAIDPRLHYQAVNAPAYAALTKPIPTALYTPGSIEIGRIGGQAAIFSNAPAELHFNVPPSATRIEAIMGLNEKAYTGTGATDGVDVLIFERLPNGGRRLLYERNLDPMRRAADRGPQNITLESIGSITGTLVFAMYPGPANNVAFDWSYWRRIEIR